MKFFAGRASKIAAASAVAVGIIAAAGGAYYVLPAEKAVQPMPVAPGAEKRARGSGVAKGYSATSDGETITKLPKNIETLVRGSGIKIDPKLMQIRQVQGVWRSQPDFMPDMPGVWVELEIAGNRTWLISLRGGTPKEPQIYAESRGKIVFDPGKMEGTAAEMQGPRSDLFKEWSATLPSEGAVMLTAKGVNPVKLSYGGL